MFAATLLSIGYLTILFVSSIAVQRSAWLRLPIILLRQRQTVWSWWSVVLIIVSLNFLLWGDYDRYFVANLLTWGLFFRVAVWWQITRGSSLVETLDLLSSK